MGAGSQELQLIIKLFELRDLLIILWTIPLDNRP